MPDKFENATLFLRLGLPSTLQRTYPHKKIRENGTFLIRSLEWNNFFLLVWTENFSYPELFEYAHVILSCDLSSQISLGQKFNMADNMRFAVLLTIISSLIAYLK